MHTLIVFEHSLNSIDNLVLMRYNFTVIHKQYYNYTAKGIMVESEFWQ